MRVTVLIAVLFGVLAASSPSHAEKVRTNAKAKVYNRPGEQGKIIVRVKEGQAMTVLAKEGRWVKVRVSGRTGFIPRTYLEMPDGDEEFARNTRRRPFVDGRSTKRSFGGSAPDDRIGADATEDRGEGDSEGEEPEEGEDEGEEKPEKKEKKPAKKEKKPAKAEKAAVEEEEEEEEIEGSDEEEPATEEEEEVKDERKRARVAEKTIAYSDPDKKSEKSFTATPKDELFVESTKGKWTEVSVEEGDIGWILSSKLDVEGGDDDDSGSEGGGGSKKRIIDTRARLGFRLISQTLTSAGGAAVWPDRYKIGSSSVAVALGGMLLFPYKKDFLVGGAVDYDMAYAIPGISFDPDGANGPMPGSTTSFIMHNARVRAVGGYNFHKKNGLVVLAKLGLHYESFLVANNEDLSKNTARLPSEVIKGPSLGLAVAIPRLTDKVGLAINLDGVLIGGSLTQTKNLEDGANPNVKRYTVSALVNYKYSSGFDLNFGYDLNYASLSFGAPIATSMRMHTGTGVARTDLNHTVSAGIAKAF